MQAQENFGFNFSAGPAMLPVSVMLDIQKELLNWQGLNRSVMEISHRSAPYMAMMSEAEQSVRRLLQIPSDYQVLFVHGSASHQFAMVPMNLYQSGTMDYVDTGTWSCKAVAEAKKFGKVNHIQGLKMDNNSLTELKAPNEWSLSDDASFLYYAPNETIGGVEFAETPDTQLLYGRSVSLVADMSSNILSKPIDVNQFGLIYAGAQKNIGTSGVTLVIIRDDLLPLVDPKVATMLQYATYAKHQSLYNTPAVFPVYVAGKVFKWIEDCGGLAAMEALSARKAQTLYDFIDQSDFYTNPINLNSRSRMNVPFILADQQLDAVFLKEAEKQKLYGLEGHRSVGGMRASLYNAMPIAGVEALVNFMKEFALNHG